MVRQGFDYDLVILGGGSAGIVAGNVAGALGARVALVEKTRIGGECLWTGCVPSKALLHIAEMAKAMRTARTLGLKNVRLTRDDCAGAFAAVRDRIETTRINDATETMLRDFGVEIRIGAGEFVRPHLFRTPTGDLKSARFLIATGSSPAIPNIPGLNDVGFLTNQTVFSLTSVPESVLILGGGYIACELGQALVRLGAKVTIVERNERLLKREDSEAVDLLTETLKAEGITVLTGTTVERFSAGEGDRKIADLVAPDDRRFRGSFSEILVAVGRQGNTEGLGLERVGVTTDEKGYVRVNAAGRTENPSIWAGGDVTGRNQFSHMAEEEAKALVRNILFPGAQTLPADLVPYAIFTDPELAQVGKTEAEAIADFGEKRVKVLRHSFRQDDRAIVEDRTTGMVKVITVGPTGKIVGATILGPRAGELIQEWVLAIRHGLTAAQIAGTVHVYPALTVSNQRAAQKWFTDLTEHPAVRGVLGSVFGYAPRDGKSLHG
ncbi:MAG: FAD-dependent oxidoreductase [Capsulimonadales bacterium]|nr:FAD-dependent oxidoreductase [Capsulimonadales bacterium]